MPKNAAMGKTVAARKIKIKPKQPYKLSGIPRGMPFFVNKRRPDNQSQAGAYAGCIRLSRKCIVCFSRGSIPAYNTDGNFARQAYSRLAGL